MSSPRLMISGSQVRAARAALRWTVNNLADKACVNKNTVMRFEKTGDTHSATIAALQYALEQAGIVFIWQDDKPGILFPS